MANLTIVTFPLINYHGSGSIAHLKIWFSQDFVTADGAMIMGGAIRSNRFFAEYDCVVDPDTHILTVPALALPLTNNSSVRNVRATALIFDSGGAFIDFLFTAWIIPEQLAPACTMAALNAYNTASNRPPSPTYPTTDQILAMFQGIALNGSLTANSLPRSAGDMALVDSQVTDDGTNVAVRTVNYVQMGDFVLPYLGGSTRLELNDNFGLAKLFAGSDGGNEYAGVWGQCDAGEPSIVRLQSTGRTHVFGTERNTFVGDGEFDYNGTTLRVYDNDQQITQACRNQAPVDDNIFVEEVSLYLDQNSGKLMFRLRLDDGTYATAELTYTPD